MKIQDLCQIERKGNYLYFYNKINGDLVKKLSMFESAIDPDTFSLEDFINHQYNNETSLANGIFTHWLDIREKDIINFDLKLFDGHHRLYQINLQFLDYRVYVLAKTPDHAFKILSEYYGKKITGNDLDFINRRGLKETSYI